MSIALLKLKDKLTESFGEDSVFFAGDMPKRPPITSGSLALDFAVGIGGLPTDRVIEVAGGEGGGKTTLGLFTMMNFLDAQPERGAIIIDTEHKLTESWVEQLIGSERMERVIVLWPDHMEQATDMYTQAVSTGHVSFVLFDSIGGSPSRRVTGKSAESGNIGGNALAVSRFAQFAATHSQKYNCLTFGVNQVREDMGGYGRHMTPGGKAWKHACILRLQVKPGKAKVFDKIHGEEVQVGYAVVAKVIKNQLAPPGRTAWWWFYNVPTEKYGFGIDTLDEVIRLSVATGVVQQRSSMFDHHAFPGGKVKGQAAMIKLVREDDSVKEVLIRETMQALREGKGADVAPMSLDPEADIEEKQLGENFFTRAVDLITEGVADE